MKLFAKQQSTNIHRNRLPPIMTESKPDRISIEINWLISPFLCCNSCLLLVFSRLISLFENVFLSRLLDLSTHHGCGHVCRHILQLLHSYPILSTSIVFLQQARAASGNGIRRIRSTATNSTNPEPMQLLGHRNLHRNVFHQFDADGQRRISSFFGCSSTGTHQLSSRRADHVTRVLSHVVARESFAQMEDGIETVSSSGRRSHARRWRRRRRRRRTSIQIAQQWTIFSHTVGQFGCSVGGSSPRTTLRKCEQIYRSLLFTVGSSPATTQWFPSRSSFCSTGPSSQPPTSAPWPSPFFRPPSSSGFVWNAGRIQCCLFHVDLCFRDSFGVRGSCSWTDQRRRTGCSFVCRHLVARVSCVDSVGHSGVQDAERGRFWIGFCLDHSDRNVVRFAYRLHTWSGRTVDFGSLPGIGCRHVHSRDVLRTDASRVASRSGAGFSIAKDFSHFRRLPGHGVIGRLLSMREEGETEKKEQKYNFWTTILILLLNSLIYYSCEK